MAALKLLSLILILCALLKAQQPDGYLGCFNEDSLINETKTCNNVNYTGDSCKAECKRQQKRFAATKHGQLCSCGDGFQNYTVRNATGCDWHCPGKTTEMCGSSSTISLYDTINCITDTCKKRGFEDQEANHNCICSDGWTGTFCDESVNSTTPQSTENVLSPNLSFLSTRLTSFISTTTLTKSAHVTTAKQRSTQISWSTESIDSKTTVLISVDAPSKYNVSATDSKNDTAVYISVPVIVLIIAVVAVIIFIITRRKRQLMKQDSNDIYNSSNGNTLSFSDENNPIYNDHDNIQLDITTCHKDTTENAISDKNGSAFEELSYDYNTIDPPYHSVSEIYTEISVDEDDYEHIKSKTNVVFDPTYSHTTNLQTKHTSDDMYSHINKTVQKTTSDSNMFNTNETYSKMNNNVQ